MKSRLSAFLKPKTFQTRLLICNMIIIISIAAGISFYNFSAYRRDTITNETNSSLNQLSALSDRLEIAYNEMVNLVVNCAERKSLFLTGPYLDVLSPDSYIMSSSDVLRDFCAISGYSSYIYKITLYAQDQFLLQAGTSFGSAYDVENIIDAPWFHEYLTQTTSQYSLKLVDNPFTTGYTATPKLLPLLRPLQYDISSLSEESWVFLGISPKLYEDAIQKSSARHIYALTKDGDVIASKDPSSFSVDALTARLLSASETEGHFSTDLNGQNCIVTFRKQPTSGLLLFEILPVAEMNLDHNVVLNTILLTFFFCIAIGLSMSLVISRPLAVSINRLTKRLELISTGNFSRDLSIETDDEIGEIGKQINAMSSRISELMASTIQGEQEKRDLEIKMLQAQINPHFLYNTLDSIKWIATMQRNSGIVQVVTALSSLLKNMAKGFNEKVTLEQELDFLQNYVTIEKIRYIELFDVEIDVEDPVLYKARLVKLTLQPIVENAIFSGIEPSGRSGLIKIRAYAKNGVLYITITDNGIGISPENIEKLLTDTSRVTRNHMSGIGLPNVDRRFKLVYGEDYGLSIESEIDQYTKVTVCLPLEF